MKNKERTKPTKKRILMYYLILAACLMAIAAVTVGLVFGLEKKPVTDNVIDGGQQPPNDGNEPENPVDTSSQYKFISPVKSVDVSQSFAFCYDQTMDWYCEHCAVDFRCAAGTDVLAAVDGTVVDVLKDDQLYGSYIVLSHANDITTVYKFIDPSENIKKGDKIERGTVIGKVATANGNENAVGDHLHFEVLKDGDVDNPENHLELDPK